MSREKLPHEFSLSELLESIEGQEVDTSIKPNFDSPILSFVQAFNISVGTKLVSDQVLHSLFKLWHRDSFIDQRNFNTQLGRYIPSVMKNRRFYLVSNKVLDIASKMQDLLNKRTIDKTKSKTWQNHFDKFLADTKLEAGNVYVESDILYYVYHRWLDANNKKRAPLGHTTFMGLCDLFFERKRLSRNKIAWFGVNENIKQLITKQEIENWRIGRKTYGSKPWIKEENSSSESYPLYRGIALYPKEKNKKKSK